MRNLVLLCLLMYPLTLLASTQASPKSSIKKIISYSEKGGGDIIVQLAQNGSQCSSGYWLKKSDPGFEANYRMLISAFQSRLDSVVIEGHAYELWSGSARGIYCHVANVQYSG